MSNQSDAPGDGPEVRSIGCCPSVEALSVFPLFTDIELTYTYRVTTVSKPAPDPETQPLRNLSMLQQGGNYENACVTYMAGDRQKGLYHKTPLSEI